MKKLNRFHPRLTRGVVVLAAVTVTVVAAEAALVPGALTRP